MSFIESYKYLEKLCGEILHDDRKVSAYIDEMIKIPNGSRLVKGWNEDLKMLKHYRWIRNQIAHEPKCTESNMCRHCDEEWVNNFYSRIMNRTDPLALYSHAIKSHAHKKKEEKKAEYHNVNTYSSKKSGCIHTILAISASLIILLYVIIKLIP